MQEMSMATESDHNARVVEQFSQQAESYAALVNRSKDTTLPVLLAAVEPQLSERLLDVGCGTGRFAVTISPFVAEVVGIDLTRSMLDQAQELQREAGAANIRWQCGDVTALPYADAEFDIVTSRAMLHHIAEPARVVSEMSRVCTPAGRIVVVDLTPPRTKSAAFDAIEILRDSSHVHAMPLEELRDIGRGLGLREITVHEYAARMPLESILKTSFPTGEMLDRVRRLYRIDAQSGGDSLGFEAGIEDGELLVSYPMSMVVWKKR